MALVVCTLWKHTGEHHVCTITASATESRNKTIIEAGFKAWGDGTGSPYDLLADDATWTIVGRSAASRTYKGREAFMRDVIRPFNARMREPLKPSIRRIYADGDTVIVFFDAQGTARDGKPYVNTYAWFLELRDGKSDRGVRVLRQPRVQRAVGPCSTCRHKVVGRAQRRGLERRPC